MMKTVFKTIQFETMPKFTRDLFQIKKTERNLRGIKGTIMEAPWPSGLGRCSTLDRVV